jgi:SAM-dependent methyltransferase
MSLATDQTIVPSEITADLGELRIRHPSGTFALTPASLIALEAIGKHKELLKGTGLDWGSGTGCLAIAAARIPAVQNIVGLEIAEANVAIARENALQNGVADKVIFLHSDSYTPFYPADRAILDSLRNKVHFILANPPSSEGDDGFGYRRLVLRGASNFLAPGGVVFLSVSYQYGTTRVKRLGQEVPGFAYRGVLASTDWVPFDLGRPDLLHCLRLYANEERRGGWAYTFQHPDGDGEQTMTAQEALAHFQKTGQSPLSKWQSHWFVFTADLP